MGTDQLASWYGLARSFAIYYGQVWRGRRLPRFYSQFVAPGDLCFDIGAHVGNRVRAFRQLGATVVAVEPQPSCTKVLELLYGRDPEVKLVSEAVGAERGEAIMRISRMTPTVSTISADG